MKVAIILKAPELNFTIDEKDVIFADAGYRFKDQLGDINVLGVVGDFDSLGCAPKGEKVVSLNVEKDFTDGERAVRYAKECGAKDIVIYGAFGGKIEHILGNIALLKIAKNLNLNAVIKDNGVSMQLIDKSVYLSVKKNTAFSIIPYGGKCSFSSSDGLYYPLDGVTLTPSDTLGISNKTLDDKVEIKLLDGECLVVYET
jgi:thiamine pyrophosphokinase